jgi:hypothetical protein
VQETVQQASFDQEKPELLSQILVPEQGLMVQP